MVTNQEVFIVSGSRTPIGTYGKSLRKIAVDDLASHVLASVIRKTEINPEIIDGIILGHGYQNSYYPNTARCALIKSGLPVSIAAMTVQRQCGSALEAINLACKDIILGGSHLMLAGGVESMSTIPYFLDGRMRFKGFFSKYIKYGPRPVIFKLADDGMAPTKLVWDLKSVYMAGTAQRLADTFEIGRTEADEYAMRSQELALAAIKSGRFSQEIDPIIIPGRGFITHDEHPRKTSLDKLTSLKAVLRTKVITAGNSSGINDGACVVMLAAKAKMESLNLNALAQYIDSVVTGVDPYQMGLGPVVAINKLLKRNNLSLEKIDLIEINEAFAVQYLACEKLLKLDRSKVNVNGGAIALGHPIGMTGARILLSLAIELKQRDLKYGIAALCIGGGMGIATLIKNPHSP